MEARSAHKQIMLSLADAGKRGDLEVSAARLAADFVRHCEASTETPPGR